MIYKLRNFENNYQVIASLGWIILVISFVLMFTKKMPGFLIFAIPGALFILWQLRGKRVLVNTKERSIKKGFKTVPLENPTRLYVNKVKLSQRVNSRTSSTQAHHIFYKAYLQDGDEKILLSSNRKEDRDLEKLKAIARDLEVDFTLNY